MQTNFCEISFVALIHPIQWTIVNLVNADPHQTTENVVLCFYLLAGPTVHLPGGASHFLPVWTA